MGGKSKNSTSENFIPHSHDYVQSGKCLMTVVKYPLLKR